MSGLGLLAVATLVVDVIAVWVSSPLYLFSENIISIMTLAFQIIPNSAYKKFKYKEAPRADLLKDPGNHSQPCINGIQLSHSFSFFLLTETTYLQSDIST